MTPLSIPFFRLGHERGGVEFDAQRVDDIEDGAESPDRSCTGFCELVRRRGSLRHHPTRKNCFPASFEKTKNAPPHDT